MEERRLGWAGSLWGSESLILKVFYANSSHIWKLKILEYCSVRDRVETPNLSKRQQVIALANPNGGCPDSEHTDHNADTSAVTEPCVAWPPPLG